jgi:hypothetical protein
MQKLPQIVLQRLQRRPADRTHPDADVLTGFAEQVLSGHERNRVIEHLSRCGECRDVAAMALPEEITAPAIVVPRRTWFGLPVLRWGALAAAIAIVASVGVLELGRRPQEKMIASSRLRSSDPEIAQPLRAEAGGVPAYQEPARQYPAYQEPARQSKAQIGNPSGQNLPAVKAGFTPLTGDAPPQPAERVNHPLGTTELPNALPASSPLGSNGNLLPMPGRNSTEVVTDRDAISSHDVEAANPDKLTAPSAPLQMATSLMAKALPRWTIAAGTLQRSFDGGKTWEKVNCDASGDTKNDRKPETKEAEPNFSVVAANGLEVWAGGPNAALYHSSDGGNRWVRVVPSSHGAALTGNISSIHFFDAQTGEIISSSSELWFTGDGGQTWQRRR